MRPNPELIISSFQHNLISGLKELAPDIRRGILTGLQTKDAMELMDATGAQILLPMFASVTTTLVDKLHSRELSIITWNCNALHEITLGVKETDAYKRQAKVTGFFCVVAGQNAQASGIDR